jgi:hypothetical protein
MTSDPPEAVARRLLDEAAWHWWTAAAAERRGLLVNTPADLPDSRAYLHAGAEYAERLAEAHRKRMAGEAK